MYVDLTVVRHGESLANAAFAEAARSGAAEAPVDGRDADVPLSALGREQSARLGRALARGEAPRRVVCSPYERARETCRIIAGEARAALKPFPEPLYDERLRDRETGVLELMTARAIEERFPEEAARRARVGDFYYRPPGGESLADVALRVRSWLVEQCDEAGVLVVAHDAVTLMLRHAVEGWDEHRALAAEPVANASVTRVTGRLGDPWRVRYASLDDM